MTMRYLLARRNAGVLAQVAAHERTLLAFDFDGTLAPIVAQRHRATMRAATAALLGRASARFAVAVISGRALADVRRKLTGSGVRVIFGGHGLPVPRGTGRTLSPLRKALRSLVALEAPALELDDKGSSLAVHFVGRGAQRLEPSVRRAFAETGVRARVVTGHRVIEFIAPQVGDKGRALREAMRRTHSSRALFIGDDRTDEDAFALAPALDVIGVRVGRRASSRAKYFVRDQREVDVLLRTLLRLRSPR